MESRPDGVALAPSKSELDRCYTALARQAELLAVLTSKLQPVSHSSPSNATEQKDRLPHISDVADSINQHNDQIAKLIEELAV